MAFSDAVPYDRRPLTERVRPDRLDSVVGNPRAVEELREWAASWQRSTVPPRLRAAVLEGPPGVGKTTASIALAHEMGWGLIEMNASDARNKTAVERVAGRASVTDGFAESGDILSVRKGGRTLILLDEADCLFSRGTETEPPPSRPLSFREFLQSRYGTVEALARGWGLGLGRGPGAFGSWDAVPSSGGRTAAFRLPAAQRDRADWESTTVRPDHSDRGGLGAITKVVRETRQPIVLTVNDPSTLTRYSPLFRAGVARIRFWPIRDPELMAVLSDVAARERIAVARPGLEAIVRRSHGDLRAAINDLDAVSMLPAGAAQDQLLGTRDVTSEFFAFTDEVLERPRVYRSVEIRNRLDATPEDLLPWMEENLPRSTQHAPARAAAFEELGRAELLLSRARRKRVFGLWSYAAELMTGGVSLALSAGGSHAPDRVAFPQFLGQMGRAAQARATRTALATKVGHAYHASRRKVTGSLLPMLEYIFRATREPATAGRAEAWASVVARELELNAEETAYLLGVEPDHSRVKRLLAEPPAALAPLERRHREPSTPGGGTRARKGPPSSEATRPAEPPRRGETARPRRKRIQKQLAEY